MRKREISCPLARHAARHPDDPAIIAPDGSVVSYAALDRLAGRAEAGLEEEGLKADHRLAIHAGPGPEMIALLLACFRRGVVAALINQRLPASAVIDACELVNARILVTDADAPVSAHSRQHSLKRLLRDRPDGLYDRDAIWQLDAPANIVFTSGSTGDSKAVLHSLDNHVCSASGSRANIPLERGDRWLLALPLYHVGGLAIVFRCLLSGGTITIPHRDEDLAESVRRRRPTHLSLVSTQLKRLLDAPDALPLSSLRAVLLGGSAIPSTLIDRALERGLPIHTSYGMSEMASQITTTRPGADRQELATSGYLLPHRELRIEDDRILVRGETRFLGYVQGDELIQPFADGGWFATGDTGFLDAEGRLVVTGRADEMFISGGENIQPLQIERALAAIDGIDSAVVVPVPDPTYGQRPFAFLDADRKLDPEDVSRRLRETLPGYMIPVDYHALPDHAPGALKLSRPDLTQLARDLRGDTLT